MPSKQRQRSRKVFCLGLWHNLQGQNLIKEQNSSHKFPTMQEVMCRVVASLTTKGLYFQGITINTNKFGLDVASSPSSAFGVLYLVISVALTLQI